jgi:hypothetical protein
MFVFGMFNKESHEYQQDILSGTILKIISGFRDKHKIDVGFFNAHQAYDELQIH